MTCWTGLGGQENNERRTRWGGVVEKIVWGVIWPTGTQGGGAGGRWEAGVGKTNRFRPPGGLVAVMLLLAFWDQGGAMEAPGDFGRIPIIS